LCGDGRNNPFIDHHQRKPTMNLTESLLHALKAHGARQIFGIPGDFALPYFRIIEESHPAAVHAVARAGRRLRRRRGGAHRSGALGVAAVTYGAGALNMINSVAAAYAEKSPLVVISGGPGEGESSSGPAAAPPGQDAGFAVPHVRGDHLRPRPAGRCLERAPADIARVLGNCLKHSRPVYIEIPRDMVAAPCAPVPAAAPPAVDADALAACADEVLQRLAAGPAPGADGGRGSAPLTAWRPRWPSWRAAWRCRWPPASWAAACWPMRMRRWWAPTWAWPGCRR
jgi:indolepyruvate decarboxylase